AALELGYSTICGVTPTPDFCSDPTAVAAKAKAEAALNTALDGAQAAINANNGTLTQADEIKLFTDIANDISQFETVVNEVKTKKARKHTS
ncbi:MAG TPA: hypothetical protein VG897_08920, partial [Terriglobales bacterium]|nr:hypothetical protein [Terriglobales bacterium]